MKKPQHRYASCRDEDCDRPLCVAYREGFEDGIQACPLAHI